MDKKPSNSRREGRYSILGDLKGPKSEEKDLAEETKESLL